MVLSNKFHQAIEVAFNLHKDQIRKTSGIPYIGHLLAVAAIVLDYGGTEIEAIAAILHDAIEDQGGKKTQRLIQDVFGDEVASIVEGCSDTDEIPKPPWGARKRKYIDHVAKATPSMILVSAADKLHNCRMILKDFREIGNRSFDHFKGGREGTLWYYRSLIIALRQRSYQNGLPNDEEFVFPDETKKLIDELERTYHMLFCLTETFYPLDYYKMTDEAWK